MIITPLPLLIISNTRGMSQLKIATEDLYDVLHYYLHNKYNEEKSRHVSVEFKNSHVHLLL